MEKKGEQSQFYENCQTNTGNNFSLSNFFSSVFLRVSIRLFSQTFRKSFCRKGFLSKIVLLFQKGLYFENLTHFLNFPEDGRSVVFLFRDLVSKNQYYSYTSQNIQVLVGRSILLSHSRFIKFPGEF